MTRPAAQLMSLQSLENLASSRLLACLLRRLLALRRPGVGLSSLWSPFMKRSVAEKGERIGGVGRSNGESCSVWSSQGNVARTSRSLRLFSETSVRCRCWPSSLTARA